MRQLLGGKGAGLHEMTRIGVPVPPGFTITTEACIWYFQHGGKMPEGLEEQVREAMARLERVKGQRFGDSENPLLVSVRSGAPVSMPGMMDTILNLGINPEIRDALARLTNNPRFAADAWRRFIQMFGNVVMGVPSEKFEALIEKKKEEKGVKEDTELTAEDWNELAEEFLNLVKAETGQEFPLDPWQQLWMAIEAVFKSWNNERAIAYREINKIPHDMGTAVNVVSMVFGNMGDDSGTGVLFTRDPSTGEKRVYGEFLPNAQGEDVVAGIRTPLPLNRETALKEGKDPERTLEALMPEIYKELMDIAQLLERHYQDMQDIEFTIERGKLWILQTRAGKRTPRAEIKIAVDMVKEGLISEDEAVLRVKPESVEKVLHPTVDPNYKGEPLAVGIPASPGAATGKVVFQPHEAEELAEKGEAVILVRVETSPEDIRGMAAAAGILTSRGGKTSHAAVVARGMGKPAVVGAEDITVDYEAKEFRVGDKVVKEGEVITIDGGTGKIFLGDVPKLLPEIGGELDELLHWADQRRRLGVRANADTSADAKRAREFGAEGIGLARTEHMFFEEDRIWPFREMILLAPEAKRGEPEAKAKFEEALKKIEELQTGDFYEILKVMEGLPVIIRLLDPPLHEFLPREPEAIKEMARRTGLSEREIELRAHALEEANPMLGHRGVRLAITFPEIYEMQARAIAKATARLLKEGVDAKPEIMIPLVGFAEELRQVRRRVERVLKEVAEAEGVELNIMVGTMIEIPRAAITADEIAKVADFFSFGTNDLTQTTLGFSRDDAGKFIHDYIQAGIFKESPFATLDTQGVGYLVELGTRKGKEANPKLEVGICGEHGGDPASIEFCHRAGLDYVSCSPFRVPVARLAAAQAALKEKAKPKEKTK